MARQDSLGDVASTNIIQLWKLMAQLMNLILFLALFKVSNPRPPFITRLNESRTNFLKLELTCHFHGKKNTMPFTALTLHILNDLKKKSMKWFGNSPHSHNLFCLEDPRYQHHFIMREPFADVVNVLADTLKKQTV